MRQVTSGEPKHKGIGVLAVVKAIKARESARAQIPTHLARYLQEPILVTSWYPERDYNALITLLASSIEPKPVGGDVWAYLGRTAAQRDIGGDQREVPERSRLDTAGVYRNFRDVAESDVPGLLLRTTKMWTLYHDTGKLSYMRHRDKPEAVILRLTDFAFPIQGLADLQTAYMVEYASLSGFRLRGERTAYWPNSCEWQFELSGDAELFQSLGRLPAWQAMNDKITTTER
jgi:hypothetical protein